MEMNSYSDTEKRIFDAYKIVRREEKPKLALLIIDFPHGF
jgi:hypothetical protein